MPFLNQQGREVIKVITRNRLALSRGFAIVAIMAKDDQRYLLVLDPRSRSFRVLVRS